MQLQANLVSLNIFAFAIFASPTVLAKDRDAEIIPMIVQVTSERNFNEISTAIVARSGLEARGGTHSSTPYTATGCSGTSLGTALNFPCGGTCWSSSTDIWSVLLSQENTGGDHPTADFYSGSSCDSTKVAHAGIWNGYYTGCTSFTSAARSYYLYYGC